jgi:dolichol-phosphate mannosyltransferase
MVVSRNNRRLRLCVVAPCYNEADVIGRFYTALKTVLLSMPDLDHRILFVDDGSQDGTLEELNALASGDASVRVYSLSRNFGHQTALTAGLAVARGDAVVMMDSDLQHPPELIPAFVDLWRQGFDVVSAKRENTAGASLVRKCASHGFYWLLNRLSETPIISGVADFCLLSRRAHRALRRMPEKHRFLRGMISWIGFQRTFVPYEAAARAGGRSKYTLKRLLSLAFDATLSFSTLPMKLATRLGLCISTAGLICLAHALSQRLRFDGPATGWDWVIGAVVLLGGAQLVFIGLIGEYLARVFEQVKSRPLYFFKQTPRASAETGSGWRVRLTQRPRPRTHHPKNAA